MTEVMHKFLIYLSIYFCEVIIKELKISGIQAVRSKHNKTGSTISKEWTTPDCRNTSSTTNPEGEEIVDAPGKDGNASMPEQVKRPTPWRKMIMMMMTSALHVSGFLLDHLQRQVYNFGSG
jgi:hypothetical protein